MDSENVQDHQKKEQESNQQNSQDIEMTETDTGTVGVSRIRKSWIKDSLAIFSRMKGDNSPESYEFELKTFFEMAVDPEVTTFLVQQKFYNHAEIALMDAAGTRVTEMVVGTIANMCCTEIALDALRHQNRLLEMIFSFIRTDDIPTLVQVVRIFEHIIFYIWRHKRSKWVQKILAIPDFGESLVHILSCGTDPELLTSTINIVERLTEVDLEDRVFFLRIIKIRKLTPALCEAMTELIEPKNNSLSQQQHAVVANFFDIMFSMIKKESLMLPEDDGEIFDRINIVLLRILTPYKDAKNLIPLEKNVSTTIYECSKLMILLQRNHVIPNFYLIETLLRILIHLKDALLAIDPTVSHQELTTLYGHISAYWYETLDMLSTEQLVQLLRANYQRVFYKLVGILNEYPNIGEKHKNKLRSVIAVITSNR